MRQVFIAALSALVATLPATPVFGQAADQVGVVVVDAGEAPMRALRYLPDVGQTEVVSMTLAREVEYRIDGSAAPAPSVPAMTTTWEQTVTKIEPGAHGARISFNLVYTGLEIAEGTQKALFERTYGPLIGMKGSGVMSDRGEILSFEHEGEATGPLGQHLQTMRQILLQLGLTLPEEPVGAGAEWVVEGERSRAGVTMLERARFRLTSVDGDRLEIEKSMEQSAGEQEMTAPGGMTYQLLSSEGSGSARVKLSLNRLAPTASRSSSNVTASFRITQRGSTSTHEQKTKVSMAFESEDK